MRLRTFESFWLLKNGVLNSYPSLQQDLETEIVIVGGGITGALISHSLIEKGHKVVLIDKRDIAQGSSAATTSMLQYEIDVPLIDLSEMIGEQAAAECYKAGITAIKNLEKLVKSGGFDCGFERKKSLYLAHSKKASKKLKQEFEIRNKHNLGVTWLDKTDVFKQFGIISHGAILSEVGASMDAFKLAHLLIKHGSNNGLQVFDQTEMAEFDANLPRPEIKLKNGFKITCDKIIFCSGYESTAFLKEKTANLFYTYACVSEKSISADNQLNEVLIWDTNNPYLYMRTTDDGRVLVGGEDSSNNFPFFQQRIKEKRSDTLIKKAKKMIPDLNFIEDYSWGGTFGTTNDGLPYIGKSPEHENALFVLGFGGNGITFSVQGMSIINDILDGKSNRMAEYYRFGR